MKLILIVMILGCSIIKMKGKDTAIYNETHKANYQIVMIDSLANYYIIYALKDFMKYKIISRKGSHENCFSIKIDSSYMLILRDARRLKSTNDSIDSKVYFMNVNCLGFDDTTTICIDKDNSTIKSLFYAENLEGLCIKNK